MAISKKGQVIPFLFKDNAAIDPVTSGLNSSTNQIFFWRVLNEDTFLALCYTHVRHERQTNLCLFHV